MVASAEDHEMAQHEGGDSDWETVSGDEIEEDQAAKCLFSEDMLPSVTAALEHDATHFGFDFHRYVKQARLLLSLFVDRFSLHRLAAMHACLRIPSTISASSSCAGKIG